MIVRRIVVQSYGSLYLVPQVTQCCCLLSCFCASCCHYIPRNVALHRAGARPHLVHLPDRTQLAAQLTPGALCKLNSTPNPVHHALDRPPGAVPALGPRCPAVNAPPRRAGMVHLPLARPNPPGRPRRGSGMGLAADVLLARSGIPNAMFCTWRHRAVEEYVLLDKRTN